MNKRVIPLRIPENLDDLAALCAREQHTDKATALRQWLHQGAVRYVLGLVTEGRISIGRAAELLDTTLYDLYRQAESLGLELGADDEERRESHALVARLSVTPEAS